MANVLCAPSHVNLTPGFMHLLESTYGARFVPVDFSDTAQAAEQINRWASHQTNGLIPEVFKGGGLPANIQLMLLNALYFKAEWASKFDANDSAERRFQPSHGDPMHVRTMYQVGHFPYVETPQLQMLELPYVGGRFAMLILLPQEGLTLPDLEQHFTPAALGKWIDALTPTRVKVFLPCLDLSTDAEMSEDLKALGMKAAFGAEADFSGMTSNRSLCISALKHQARIKVAEEGTEAAAVTAMAFMDIGGISREMPSVIFNADHSFGFVVRDRQTGHFLFMGRMDPAA
jgi:serpin B